MNAKDAKKIADDRSQKITFDEISYQDIINKIKEQAEKGFYVLRISSRDVGIGVESRLDQDEFNIYTERRIDGYTVISWK